MIGSQELILILIASLFLFGPSKLPELAQSLGKAVGEFKKAQYETEHQLNQMNKTNNKDIKIHNLAIEMGIDDAENKTTEQLVEEIRTKVMSRDEVNIQAVGA